MKKSILIVAILISIISNAQEKNSDYFSFYKGGEKFLKPVKYILFDSISRGDSKKTGDEKIYFYIGDESFVHKKKQKIETCSSQYLKKIKLENPYNLQEDAFKYFKAKKLEVEKKHPLQNLHILYPITGFNGYFKIYILEKENNHTLLKYEVDWIYAIF